MATNTEKIDAILKIVQEIQTQNVVQALEIEDLQDCTKEHDADIDGNGNPGLKADMGMVKANLKLINWIGGIITAAVVLDAVSRLILLVH